MSAEWLILALVLYLLWLVPIRKKVRHRTTKLESPSLVVFLTNGGGLMILSVAAAIAARVYLGGFRWWELPVAIVVVSGWPLYELFVHKYEMHTWRWDPLYHTHSLHHQYPYDSRIAIVPLRVGFFYYSLTCLFVGLGTGLLLTIYTVVLCILTFYEYMHYLIHTNHKPRTRYGRWITQNHRAHHFVDEKRYLGLLFPFWKG